MLSFCFTLKLKVYAEGLLQGNIWGETGILEVLPLVKLSIRWGFFIYFSELVLTKPRWRGIVLPTGPARESDRAVTGRGTQASVSHWYGTAMTCRHFSIRSPGLWSSILERRDLTLDTDCNSKAKCERDQGERKDKRNNTPPFFIIRTVSLRNKDDAKWKWRRWNRVILVKQWRCPPKEKWLHPLFQRGPKKCHVFLSKWQSPVATIVIMSSVHWEQGEAVVWRYYGATKSTEGGGQSHSMVFRQSVIPKPQ